MRLHRHARWPTFLLLLIAWAGIAGITGPAQAQDGSKYGGAVTYAEGESVNVFNPYQVTEERGVSDRLFTLLYDSLVEYDFDSERTVPALATSWTPRGDAPTDEITFQLRDADWHDGEPFTADDVKFTFDYIQQAGSNADATQRVASLIESVEADWINSTVTFQLRREVPQVAQRFAGFWIIPEHRFNDQMLPAGTPLRDEPVGTGPYQFIDRNLNGRIDLQAFEGYWEEDSPYIAETKLKRILDPTTMFQQAVGGGIQLIIETPPTQIGQLEASADFDLRVSPSLSFDAFAYDNAHPILGQKTVRRAFTYAVDRETILRNFYADKGTALGGPLVPDHPFFNPDVQPLPYDRARARQLLDQAGYRDRDGDGVRETQNGEPLSFEVVTLVEEAAVSPVNQNVAESYANALEAVGVEIEIVPQVKEEYLNTVFDGQDFEIAWVRWEFDPSYDISTLFMTGGKDNITAYRNDQADRLFEAFQSADDPEARRSRIYDVQTILAEDMPYTFLYTVENYTAINLKIISGRIDPYYFFSYYDDWYIAPEFR